MSSEHLASAQTELKGDLGASWNILDGASANYTDLGVARRFGGAAAAYSLRDIGAINGSVVRVRREPHDTDATINDEENFSAHQVQDGILEDWVNGKLEDTLPADVATAQGAYSLRKVKASYSGNAVRIRRSSDDIEVNVAFDSDGKVSTSSAITNVAEQGGESGQTTNTNLGDFISGTDAFVHTWYNQSGDGSNGATQATSTKQPKIATSGTLLDHLLFDGTDDFLADTNVTFEGAVSLACVSEKAADGLYPLSAARQSAANRFFALQEQASTSVFIARNSASQSISATTSGNKRLTFARTNSDTSYSVASMGRGLQTGTNDYGAAPTAALINQVVIGSRETGSSGTPSVGTWNGKIFEAITYQTDQTDNKFKIESNINNYYSLYNDELELNGEAKPASSVVVGGVTYSSGTLITLPNKNSLEYTLNDVETGNRFMRYMVNPNGNLTNLSNGDVVYVSFNLTAPDGLSIIAQLRDNFTGVSSTASFSKSGFKSFALTRNSTSGTVDNIMFQSSGVGNATISMTDIKVSRIARNGFVETLYDQSGNGDDMTQATAGSQPAIIQNGGQVRLENGKPAFKGDGTDDHLEASYFYSAGEVTALSTFSVVSNRADTGEEKAIISAGSGVSTTYSGFNTALDKDANSDPFEQRVANASGTKETSLVEQARDGDILGSTFFTKDGTHLIKATTADGTTSTSAAITVGAYRSSTTSGKLRIGATRTFALQRFFSFPIAETMVFRADLRDEGIEDEINQFYNIG